jgi:hypothetical protein
MQIGSTIGGVNPECVALANLQTVMGRWPKNILVRCRNGLGWPGRLGERGLEGGTQMGDIQFAVTKLFGTGSQVPFLAAIISWYRKLMGSITERGISGSNSNSPNNTG